MARAKVAEAQIAEAPPAGTREVVRATTPANDSVALDKPKASDIDANAPLVVRVLDSTGAPVQGVGLEWLVKLSMGAIQTKSVAGLTDAHGLIEVNEARRFLEMRYHPEPKDEAFAGAIDGFGVRCTWPFTEYQSADATDKPGAIWITAEPTPGQPIDLLLPPSGWVEFTLDSVESADGTPLSAEAISITRSDDSSRWSTGAQFADSTRSYRFGPVGLGWELQGVTFSTRVYRAIGLGRAPGPTKPGETVVIPIQALDDELPYARLSGRVVDAAGQAIANRTLLMTIRDPATQGTAQPSLRLDASGHFALELSRARLAADIVIEDYNDKRRGRGGVTLDLSDPEQRLFDLGTITLEPTLPPIMTLVSGHVYDAQNEPVQRAWVYVDGQALTLKGKAIQANAESSQPWTQLAAAYTGKDGSYTLAAQVELTSSALRVGVEHADFYKTDARDALVGDTNVDFVLEKGSAVTLNVAIDPLVLMTESVALRFKGNGRNNSPSLGDFRSHYNSRFSGLTPGTYTFQVELNSEWVLYEQQVDVKAGQTVDLGTIDLGGQLKLCNLALVDPSGLPVEIQYVQVVESATQKWIDRSARIDKLGHLDLAVPADMGDLLILGQDGASAIIPASLLLTPKPGNEPARPTITLAN